MRVIIVEDEEPARQLIRKYLSETSNIQVIGECPDGYAAVIAINKEKPDVVLLDIQLPRLNGFEVLELIEHEPQVIFTTAFDEYAIKAFEQNATDYLLKPFSKERLTTALEKAAARINSKQATTLSPSETAGELTAGMPISRIVVKDVKGINIIPANEVHYLEAQDDYVMIYTSKGRYMKKQTLKHFEDGLPASQFIRVHRSYITNIAQIDRLEPYEKESYVGIMKSGAKIKVSSTGYKNLREKLNF